LKHRNPYKEKFYIDIMKLAGFNFNKINVERSGELPKELKINSNIDVLNIKDVKSDFFKVKEQLVEVSFNYKINYLPDYATLELGGNIILSLEPKIARDVLAQWKEKKMPVEFKIALFNFIIRKSSVKALQLEEEMNLPYHIPFPSVKAPVDNSEEKK